MPASSENSISASYVRVDEVLALIESIYFVETKRDAAAVEENETNSRATATTNESTTDVAEFELHKLNLVKFDVAAVSATLARLEQQRDAIGRRVSEIILKNSQAYSQELQRISDLKLLVQDCHQLCGMSRRSILMSNLVSIKPALSLVRKQAKKLCLVKLLKIIQAVKHFVGFLPFANSVSNVGQTKNVNRYKCIVIAKHQRSDNSTHPGQRVPAGHSQV